MKTAKVSREKAQADVEGAKTRIEEYQKELPKQEKQRADRLAAYEKGIEEAGLTEEAWRALTDQYALSEADRLQKETRGILQKPREAFRAAADGGQGNGGKGSAGSGGAEGKNAGGGGKEERRSEDFRTARGGGSGQPAGPSVAGAAS